MSLGAWIAVAFGIGAVIVVVVLAVLDRIVPDDWTDGPGE